MFPEFFTDDVFRLETPRLWLRWPRAQDAARIAELAGDQSVAEMTTHIPHPYPPGAAAEFVLTSRAGNLAGEKLVLALTLKQRPTELIGVVGLDSRSGEAVSLGYWLGKPYRGLGLMSEAACWLISLVFRSTGIEAVNAVVLPENRASRGVLEGLGFSFVGAATVPAPARGGEALADSFALTRPAWDARAPCGAARKAA